MARRARNGRFNPADGVTYGELKYLQLRFADDEAAVAMARERVGIWLQRFVKRGFDPRQLHEAIMRGTDAYLAHQAKQQVKQSVKPVSNKDRKLREHARAAVEAAAASLRQLLPDNARTMFDDDWLFAVRETLLQMPDASATPTQSRRGRPWQWKQTMEDALRELHVPAKDVRELSAALGFIDDPMV